MRALAALGGRIRRDIFLLSADKSTPFSTAIAQLIVVGVALWNAVAIVQALNLYHTLALNVPLMQPLAVKHGLQILTLERHLHLAIEPAVQRLVLRGCRTPLGFVPGAALRSGLVWIYLSAFPAWLFAALTWSYVYRRQRFAVLRDLTVLSALMSVACYWLYPTAPPRIAMAASQPSIQDWTYGGVSVDPRVLHLLGFNPFASFPSVHLLWALIPALCLAAGSRSVWIWLGALCFPLTIAVAVIATGNHYVLDCVGSLVILAISSAVALAIDRVRRRLLLHRHPARYELPAAACLCLTCAGILATVGIAGGIRVLIALEIMLMIVFASGRSRYLWVGRRRLRQGRQTPRRWDYAAGLLFVAGASAATQHASGVVTWPTRVSAVLWLMACMCALARHIAVTPARDAGGHSRGIWQHYRPQLQRHANRDSQQPAA
jgi:hypothetical protein